MPSPEHTGPGLADEQALKRQRYEDALDRWAGFEPGESRLSDEEIMARGAARQGAANPQPRGFAGHSPANVPFDALVAQLMMRPGMAEHLEGIDLDGDGIPDVTLGSPPMDPMGRMQWQAMMQQRKHMAQVSQHRKAQRKAVNNQVILAHLRAQDPLFPLAHGKIEEYVRALSPKMQRSTVRAVEETPGAYLELYKEMRDLLALTQRLGGHGVSTSAMAPDPREAVRQAVAGRMSPPLLESAGVHDDRVPGAAREAERKALVKRVKAGGAREGDLLRYLELCGV